MDAPLLAADFKFMFFGMGMAFLLFVVIKIAALVRKFFSQPVAEKESISVPVKETQKDNKKVVAAITAAIIHYREGK
ncbi:MAG: OadG family transporter subunit [Campylobacterales bacterium]|nr:OadG family transporter subunit [Campylobacterales bacterium]